MDDRDQQFCVRGDGQPLCARTFNYLYEQVAHQQCPTDWADAPPSLPLDPGSTINTGTAGGALRHQFQITPWPEPYNAVRQTVTNNPYIDNNIDMTASACTRSTRALRT